MIVREIAIEIASPTSPTITARPIADTTPPPVATSMMKKITAASKPLMLYRSVSSRARYQPLARLARPFVCVGPGLVAVGMCSPLLGASNLGRNVLSALHGSGPRFGFASQEPLRRRPIVGWSTSEKSAS